jgi:hypothetical protein
MERTRPWMAGIGLILGAAMAAASTLLVQEPKDTAGVEASPPAVQDRPPQDSPKRRLRQQIRALVELERDPATSLTSPQAKQLLSVLKPWTTRGKMTEADAVTITRTIEQALTAPQLKAIAEFRPHRGPRVGGPGSPPPGYGGPGGPGNPAGGFRPGGEGGPPPFDARRAAMRDANILSTTEKPDMPWTSRRAQANRRLIALLEARGRAAAKPPTPGTGSTTD